MEEGENEAYVAYYKNSSPIPREELVPLESFAYIVSEKKGKSDNAEIDAGRIAREKDGQIEVYEDEEKEGVEDDRD